MGTQEKPWGWSPQTLLVWRSGGEAVQQGEIRGFKGTKGDIGRAGLCFHTYDHVMEWPGPMVQSPLLETEECKS